MNRQKGVSLSEVLVGLVLSSFLIMLLMNQFAAMKRHYMYAEKKLLHTLDEQLIVDLMRDSIRQGGFSPCLAIEYLSTIDCRSGQKGLTSIDIQSTEPHGFQMNHMSARYNFLLKKTADDRLKITHDLLMTPGRPVLIADCSHAEVHTIHHVDVGHDFQDIMLDKPLKYTYTPPVYVGEWLEEHFFVRNDKPILFYQLGHVDALSNDVKALSVLMTMESGKRFVHVALQWDNDEILKLDTFIRSV